MLKAKWVRIELQMNGRVDTEERVKIVRKVSGVSSQSINVSFSSK